MNGNTPALSIIICTYDRYELVEQSAQAVLSSGSFRPDRMELIIVDNTPVERRSPLNFDRVVACDEPGLSRARNVGIEASKGDIVAFLDDDAFVAQHWCGSIIDAFNSYPDARVCGGRTIARHSTRDLPVWYFDDLARHLSCIDWGEDARALRRGEWIVGANMAFRRGLFDAGRRFDPGLGRKGTASLLSNEEVALIHDIGFEHVYYIPEMEVEHLIPEDRVALAWFRKRVFWQAVSDVLAGTVHKASALALDELREIIARAPADQRGYNLLSYEPATPQAFRDQLSAVYANAVLLAEGFSCGSPSG